MAVELGAAVTRKIGPLPAWGWGVAIGGAVVAVKLLKGGGSGGSVTSGSPAVVGGSVDSGGVGGDVSASDITDLQEQLSELEAGYASSDVNLQQQLDDLLAGKTTLDDLLSSLSLQVTDLSEANTLLLKLSTLINQRATALYNAERYKRAAGDSTGATRDSWLRQYEAALKESGELTKQINATQAQLAEIGA